MKTSSSALAALVAIAVAVVPTVMMRSDATAVAQEHQDPGMCDGRTDANVTVTAHANGRPEGVPKFILNVSTDGSGNPSGTLVLGRGADRLEVQDWCRVWQHLPGQPYGGQCEADEQEGATNLHAVGVSARRDGQEVLVRTDLRANDEGEFFRVRYRPLGTHHAESAAEEEGCNDDSWTRVPTHGWYPLDQLKARNGAVDDVVADRDGDAAAGAIDNCAVTANRDQQDSDEDGQGDACDATPSGQPKLAEAASTPGPTATPVQATPTPKAPGNPVQATPMPKGSGKPVQATATPTARSQPAQAAPTPARPAKQAQTSSTSGEKKQETQKQEVQASPTPKATPVPKNQKKSRS